MKIVTFAAGLAVGYVLGTRAGRERYQLIVDSVRKVGSHPTVVRAEQKAKDLIATDPSTSAPDAAAGSVGFADPVDLDDSTDLDDVASLDDVSSFDAEVDGVSTAVPSARRRRRPARNLPPVVVEDPFA